MDKMGTRNNHLGTNGTAVWDHVVTLSRHFFWFFKIKCWFLPNQGLANSWNWRRIDYPRFHVEFQWKSFRESIVNMKGFIIHKKGTDWQWRRGKLMVWFFPAVFCQARLYLRHSQLLWVNGGRVGGRYLGWKPWFLVTQRQMIWDLKVSHGGYWPKPWFATSQHPGLGDCWGVIS